MFHDSLNALKAMEAELDSQRARVKELQSAMNGGSSKASALTNKKDEDDVYDIEAAVLTGAGGSFKPLSGALRGAVFPLNTKAVVAVARRLDKLAIAVDQRPAIRGGLMLYFFLLHLLVVLF